MNSFSGDVLANLATAFVLLVGGYLAPRLWDVLSGVFGDTPKISGRWEAEYSEPTETPGPPELVQEEVRLYQMGRLVWGSSKVIDNRNREFDFRGKLVRATFTGTVKAKASGKPAGTGTFQVQVSGDDRIMSGWCTWHDADTDRIESSRYDWRKAD